MPQSLGHSVSLVSALIIGDAAIATGLAIFDHLCSQHPAIAVFYPPRVQACHLCASARCCWQGLPDQWDWQQRFRLFAQPRQNQSIGVPIILCRTRSRSFAFRHWRSAPQLPAAVGAEFNIWQRGKENGGHEALDRRLPAALTLSVVTAALADGIPQSVSVCRALWLGAVSAVCLCVLSALAVAMLQNKAPSLAVRLALTAGLFMELVHPRAGTRAVHGRFSSISEQVRAANRTRAAQRLRLPPAGRQPGTLFR